jgi:hypothetical protein
MFGETTDPNLGHPTAPTVFDQRELLQRLEAAYARRARHEARTKREPALLWEEPGIHGAGRQANLRPTIFGADVVGAKRTVNITPDMLLSSRLNPVARRAAYPVQTYSARLPAPPTAPGILTTRNVAIAAGVVGAAALGWYLWRRSQAHQEKK